MLARPLVLIGLAIAELGCNSVCDQASLRGVAALTKRLKALFPHETEAMVRVHGDVPMQALVSLLDTIRGEGCVLRGWRDGEYVPEECQFFQPIVDAEPALLFPTPTADPP